MHQVEVALQAKDAEIAQLRGTVSAREPRAVDPSGTSTSEERDTSAQMVSSSGAAQTSGVTEEAASESLKTQARYGSGVIREVVHTDPGHMSDTACCDESKS